MVAEPGYTWRFLCVSHDSRGVRGQDPEPLEAPLRVEATAAPRAFGPARFHRIIAFSAFLCCSSICQSPPAAALDWAGSTFFLLSVRACGRAAPEFGSSWGPGVALLGEESKLAEEQASSSGRRRARYEGAEAGFSPGFGWRVFGEMSQANGQGDGTGQRGPDGGGAPSGAPGQQQQAEQFVDRIVKQRLEQAFYKHVWKAG